MSEPNTVAAPAIETDEKSHRKRDGAKKKKKKKKTHDLDLADLENELDETANATTSVTKKKKKAHVDDEVDLQSPPPPVARPVQAEAETVTPVENMTGTFEPFWARAIGDFIAQEEGDLTIKYLQMVEILDMQPNGWWAGRIGARVGWLPSNHLERVDPLEIFLQKIGLMKQYALLVKEDIDMESLKLLSDEDLASIGMKLGPRKQLLDALADPAKVKRLSQPRDISHQEVKKTLSKTFRTGEEPQNSRVTKDKEKSIAGARVRTSQFMATNKKDATEEDYIAAAVYLKVIVPEQNCYKILAFEGNMKVKDMLSKIQARLAQRLKKNLTNYALFMPTMDGGEITLDNNKLLGTYKPANMSCIMLRAKPKRGLFK